MKTVGEAETGCRLAETGPSGTDWGHTGYVFVESPILLDEQNEIQIFFTPKKGTSFEEIEALALEMDRKLAKIHFNINPRQAIDALAVPSPR